MKMLGSIDAPKIEAEKVIERMFKFRQISRIDQHLLMSTMLSKESLSETDYQLINRVFDGLEQGMLQVVD